MSSPCEMAPFGHSGSQAPQLMHSSVMKVAIRLSSRGRRTAYNVERPGPCTRAGRPENSFGCAVVQQSLYEATQQSTWHTSAQACESCWPLHSVHYVASIT